MSPSKVIFVVLIATFALQPASAFFGFLSPEGNKGLQSLQEAFIDNPLVQCKLCLFGSPMCKFIKKDEPKKDEPKTEEPKKEDPKAEAPAPEAPKPEAPQPEAPKPEAPKP